MVKSEKKALITNIFVINRVSDMLALVALFAVCLSMNANLLDPYLTIRYSRLTLLAGFAAALILGALLLRSKVSAYARGLAKDARALLVPSMLYSVGTYLCYVLCAVGNGQALRLSVRTSFLLLAFTMGSLVRVLPISVAGIGTRDLLLVFVMGLVGVPAEKAVTLSFAGFILIPYMSLFSLLAGSHLGALYANRHHG
jgi:uncharacterized membrane protein YbhN (UPF0104 family)